MKSPIEGGYLHLVQSSSEDFKDFYNYMGMQIYPYQLRFDRLKYLFDQIFPRNNGL